MAVSYLFWFKLTSSPSVWEASGCWVLLSDMRPDLSLPAGLFWYWPSQQTRVWPCFCQMDIESDPGGSPPADAGWSSLGLYSHCWAEPRAPCHCAVPSFITTGGGKIPELLLGFFWGNSNGKEECVLCYRTTEMRTQLLTRPLWSHPAQCGPHKACQGSETRFPTQAGTLSVRWGHNVF